ncbi:hypothetical protein BDE36_0919 [Arcticibacter tournemirensis]|uniref:Uncharacterized protein n=1 Tax=Arcticibacter tournemirensis TaxID=699437 RepID=A0A5M9HI39_9SPHI|nr:hypothetical protein [Arcticibacter tournemirensis]KAA8486682.1 hypothetical protein F1649_00270 [Arcticibacter tournemirensis]TQM49219.1 hypothetical protein BDE36_0919 [Arcticibacter tournemirensis]
MTRNRALTIKNWIKTMGFELTKSHHLDHRTKKIKYYTLGNFGVYEEITPTRTSTHKKQKFISWTPWGDHFEVNSVRDLSQAYQNFLTYNPN